MYSKKNCGFGASVCPCWISVKYEMYASECVQREEHLCSALLPLIEAASIVSLSEFYPYSILIGRIVRIQARNRRCIIIHVWKWMCTEREVTPVARVLVVTSSRSDNTCCSYWSLQFWHCCNWSLQFWHSTTSCTSTVACTNTLTSLISSVDKSTMPNCLLLLPAFTVELLSETRRPTWVLRLEEKEDSQDADKGV